MNSARYIKRCWLDQQSVKPWQRPLGTLFIENLLAGSVTVQYQTARLRWIRLRRILQSLKTKPHTDSRLIERGNGQPCLNFSYKRPVDAACFP